MKKGKVVIIPRDQLPTGIAKCLEKAQILLEDAQILLGKTRLCHASVLYSFGLEEFGKAALLQAAFEDNAEKPRIEGFFDHEKKLKKAADYVPLERMRLFGGAFQSNAFQEDAFQVDVIADVKTRLQNLWTDWDEENQCWRQERDVDEGLLSENIVWMQKKVREKKTGWGLDA